MNTDELTIRNVCKEFYTLDVAEEATVIFENSKIQHLTVSGNITSLICNKLGVKTITFLNVPKLTFLYCEYNKLAELLIPPNCAMVYARNNALHTLELSGDNTELWYLDVRNNNLTSISFEFPQLFYELNIEGNPPVHFNSCRWMWLSKELGPDAGLCEGDWKYRKPLYLSDIYRLYLNTNDPIVL
jgi:Leucine-rich repeat (LRR) protein